MLTTPWGERLDENRILIEYPRPQMRPLGIRHHRQR